MEKRYVAIWFPYLATDWFERQHPALKNNAFVLSAPSHGRMMITAANSDAQKLLIREGMVLADARAICPTLQYFDDKPDLTGQLLQRIAEWCIRFTPIVAIDPPGGLILDASGCSHLWGSEEEYVLDIIKRLATRGYFAKAAMADTIGAAWAITRFGKERVVEKDNHLETLLALPPEALRLDENTIARLHKLGLNQIKHLVTIPAASLRRRFGPLLLQRINQIVGREHEFIEPIIPPEPYQVRLPCIEPIARVAGIEIALRTLLEQLCERMQKEGKGLRTACFKGHRLDGKIADIQISTSRASCNVNHLFHLFEMKLPAFEPDLGIELFLLEVTRVEDYTPAQEQFWKESAALNDQPIAELIDRLTGKINPDAIQRYLPDEHHLPERSFKKATSLSEQPTTQWPTNKPRPILLLERPEKIEVTAPIPDYPPLNFRYKGQLHKVVKADGPERIEQEWWLAEGEHRDYYTIEDEQGCRYWLFRAGHYNEEKKPHWFLHGFFA
ncbi:nucleotidyltransferase [Niastella yeongjuensis]|uniref:Nucleotidyltransferase n=1 Tax=Niastella yeongjuensis TaxID=354355 RepID=A0A1V9DYD8_9BACT|nr:DNA polymerase Y family protein [Niastella yeongjuensis]OQP38898.1 nucleotidyltransferase [Niastella yeongjuensis]SEO28514.1 protein ImuB [Niastella yeongjuensis]